MMKNKRNAFTLVELLAVIVILAIILVIAVPKVMSIIKDAKKGTLETTAKMIASAAEKKKLENTILESDETIECESVAKLNDIDYADCKITFDGNTAKVKLIGSEKFEGLYVCGGTKTISIANEEKCIPVFKDDDLETIVSEVKQAEKNGVEYPYNVGDEKAIDMDIDGDNTLEQYTIRVANKTKCSTLDQKGETVISKTACGFVLEFKDIITKSKMSTKFSNAGGWDGTIVEEYINNTLLNALPEQLKKGIIDTYVVSGHGKDDETGNLDNYNFGDTYKIYLLSSYEVWGGNPAGRDSAATNIITRQLDYYADNGVTTSANPSYAKKQYQGTATNWWLRSATNNYNYAFMMVRYDGTPDFRQGNYYINGISPAFRLGE